MTTLTFCDGDCGAATSIATGVTLFATGTYKVLVKTGADDAHLRIRTDEAPFHLCESCARKALGSVGISTEKLLIGPEYDINPLRSS